MIAVKSRKSRASKHRIRVTVTRVNTQKRDFFKRFLFEKEATETGLLKNVVCFDEERKFVKIY